MSSASSETSAASSPPVQRRRLARLSLGFAVFCAVLAPGFGRADADPASGAHASRGSAEEVASTRPHQIVFRGNVALSERELRKEAVDELKDFERLGYRPADADDAAFQMEIAYRRAGFPFASVDYRIERLGEAVVLTFIVSEGSRVRVRRIEFHGNSAFSDTDLLPFFEEPQAGVFGKTELLYVASQVDAAVSSIRDLYYERGYLDTAIRKPEVTFSEDRKWVTISVHIEEGTRYVIHEVVFGGDVLPGAKSHLDQLGSELTGRSYFPRRKLRLRSGVLEIYGNLGYPDATAEVEEQIGQGGQVVLKAQVVSGPLVTISGIAVEGNERTRERFIRRRVAFRPGDPYSLDKKRKSFRELYRTGIFSRVFMTLQDGAETAKRELVVEVEEAPSKELYLEPGWGSYELLRATVGFRENNLFGTGRIGSVELMGAIRAQRFTVRLTDPWFLNTDVTADFPFSVRRREEPSFTRTELGASALFSRRLTEQVTGTAGYEFRWNRLSDVSAADVSEDEDDKYTIGMVGAQLTYDTRDDLFFPTQGQRSFVSTDLAETFLGGDVAFLRFTGGTRFFFKLAPYTIFGVRYRGGLIIPGDDEISLPIGERFFNGGGTTVRSFRESELGPKDSSGDPVGGQGFNVVNVELRHRIKGNLVGTIFFDWGNVSPNRTRAEEGRPPYENRSEVLSDTLDDFFGDFRPGVGFGLQYLLPVGPARFDFAFNPDRNKERDEDFFVFHFSVGAAF